MKTLKQLILLIVLLSSSCLMASNKPNILFILADDLGVDAVKGFNIGDRHATTPNLDKLRETGITFTNAWATPVCAASRASLLTGKYGLNNGVTTIPGVLSTEHKSIFKEIQEQSNGEYANCLTGKWHLAQNNNYQHPFEHGVDDFMGVMGAGVADYYNWMKYENGKTEMCNTYATTYFTDYAIDWIKEQEKPWFMWLAHVTPHAPLHVPPEGTFSVKNTDINRRKYKAMIESMDYEIGRLLDSIPEDDLNNTLIIFLGDNGTPSNLLSEYPDRRGKQTLYQGGINVPLIIAGKGVTRKNEYEDALINASDFYITLAQIVNPDAFPSDTVFDSYSFKHLLDGTEGTNRSYNFMQLGANANVPNDLYTVRNQQYKLIDFGNGTFEFYDLKADTFELNNLWNGTLSAAQENARDELWELMTTIRGEEPYKNDTTTKPVGKAQKYPVVHTGVNTFYSADSEISAPETTNYLFGQDAGRTTNSPSYTDNGDGTITDNITGLTWEKDMGQKLTWEEAVEKAENLGLGGYTDWRIPNINELYSLILFTGRVMGADAVTAFIDTDYFIQPFGDESIGERTIDAQVWSSTFYKGLTMNADTTIFGVNFVDGRIKGYPKFKPRTGEDNKMYFRMVRGNTDYGNNLFIDNSDGTVTDSATMLMWQKADDGVARDWLQALEYCEKLELAGHANWHLPNAKELQSIVDYSRSPWTTNSAAIDTVFSVSEISDPDGNSGHFPYYWASTTHLDGPNPYNTAVYLAFGKALGKMNGNLMDVHGAGAQRSDPKTGNSEDYPAFHGPQGDVQMVYNHCRCVRELKDVSTNIDETQWNKALIYPNPVNDKFSLVWQGQQPADLKMNIYNLNGEVLLSQPIFDTTSKIDISHLTNGIYFLVLESENKQINRKILKL